MFRLRSCGVVGVLLLLGCGGRTIIVNGIEVYESHWNKAVEELRARVEFDLGCPPDQVEFLLFKRTGRAPSEVGVSGCSKRGTYVRAVAYGQVGPWVLNTSDVHPVSGEASAPAVTPAPPLPSPPSN